ncbi:MAG: CHASE3 domain-containing protein [Silvibacterium sp.]
MNPREFRRILRQALFVPILLLLLLAGFFLLQIGKSSILLRAINHSNTVTAQVIDLQKLILDQETGVRGYELTNDPEMLAPYNAGTVPIQKSFDGLRQLLAGNELQQQRLAILSDRYQIWLGLTQSILSKDPNLGTGIRVYKQGQQMMNGIRDTVNAMLHEEDLRRRILSAAAPDFRQRLFVAILSASLCIGLAVALFTRERLRKVSRSYNATLDALEQRSREVHESRQWFQTTLESIGDAVISCDIGGRVEFLNAVASGLTGWTMYDALGQPLTEVFRVIHEETRERAENPVEMVLRQNKAIALTNRTVLISRQGREFVIDDSAAPILDARGEMTGVVLVFRDVTEQRRSEAALIAGEKLAVAGRLTASIAHEIHNPLDSVGNLLFLLRDEQDPAKRTEYLQMAQQELGRTMQISRTMLSLYREPKAPVPVDLKDLIEGVLLLLERRIAQLQIEVKSEFLEPCVVEGFPAELRQVVTNVLVNAIEAAGPHGHMRVRLETAPPEEFRGTGALIEVADSGSGITDAAAQRIFQPFFTTKGELGTGLGLWVSMGIVQKHGGMIRLQNCGHAVYAGACARIYLPEKTLASADKRVTAHVG